MGGRLPDLIRLPEQTDALSRRDPLRRVVVVVGFGTILHMIGRSKVVGLAETAFDAVEVEAPEDATVGVVMLILEVRMRDPDQTAIYEFSSDKRTWVQRAILNEALETVGMGVPEV